MELTILDCFHTEEENSGNQAAVITNFNDGTCGKQKLAQKLYFPVTVFISNENSDAPLLEYFSPNSEMPLCLHGTIAASEVLFLKNARDRCTFSTPAGYALNVSKKDSLIQVELSKKASPNIEIDKPTVCELLNILDESIIDNKLPITVSSIGSPKLFIPIKSKEALFNLEPNFSLIKEWSIANQVNGLYLYAPALPESGVDFITRGLNPKTGHNEDAATGVATAGLALYLKKSLVIRQGENLGKPCRIVTTYIDDMHIFVGGNVSKTIA
jgi:PhzF family phenazine biosynthesis protein